MEEVIVETERVLTAEKIRQKLIQMGAKKTESIVKASIPGKLGVTLEYWKSDDGESIIEIRGTKVRVFNLMDESEFE